MFKEDKVVDEQGRKVLKPAAHTRRKRIQDMKRMEDMADTEDLDEPESEEPDTEDVFTSLMPGPEYGEAVIVDLSKDDNEDASSSHWDPKGPAQDEQGSGEGLSC